MVSLVQFFPFLKDLLALFVFAFYIFTAIGVVLFAATLNSTFQPALVEQFREPLYIYLTFNDVASSFNVLQQIVLATWDDVADVYGVVFGANPNEPNNWPQAYFIIWYVIGM